MGNPEIYADSEFGLIKVLKRKLADIGPSGSISVYEHDALAIVTILEAYAALSKLTPVKPVDGGER